MPERDQLLVALTKEVLGPRNGASEVLGPDEDPLEEYITGVLAPHLAASVAQDAEADLVGEGDPAADDQSDAGAEVAPAAFDPGSLPAPSLDPRARPASLGITFVLGGQPSIDLCCTWARYAAGPGGGWRRTPHGHAWTGIDCRSQPRLVPPSDNGVEVVIRCRTDGPRWRVTVFLVNRTSITRGGRPRVEEHVFQPEIRVLVAGGGEVLPIEEGAPGDEEDESLALLYRDRLAMARGHLCGAVWKAVDPQRPSPTGPLPLDPPFAWLDGPAAIAAPVHQTFAVPDVRTEYVPCFTINAPHMDWSRSGVGPQLDPALLSETWAPADIRSALEPLADGYQAWIQAERGRIASLPPRFRAIGNANLDRCQQACDRVRRGIDVLVADEEARLAFCFANKAIAVQAAWKRRPVQWRPFQLAFQLLNIPALVDDAHPEREIADLLWFPTGGGKTEAYLGLAAFALGLRRTRAVRAREPGEGLGTAVLSRYTLRLLTVQQFRRALALITACEFLRVQRGTAGMGWRPKSLSGTPGDLWGKGRFSVGLWVGGSVTPNGLQDFTFMDRLGRLQTVRGAISILEGEKGEGEPAQVLNCPSCEAILAVPPDGYQSGERRTLHLVVGDVQAPLPAPASLSNGTFQVTALSSATHVNPAFATVSISMTLLADARAHVIDDWFTSVIKPRLGPRAWLVSARASRPGYFVRTTDWGVRRRSEKPFDFEVFCPGPDCELNTNVRWSEQTPGGPWPVLDAFASTPDTSSRVPIPAWTVDEQVYGRVPSMVIATVDKFARLAFKPEAGAIFGNVDRYSVPLGYYRSWCAPRGPTTSLPARAQPECQGGTVVRTGPLSPPEFILQDELHLIEGPLGSMVGLYETAVDVLAAGTARSARKVKYIASTATVRRADEQVSALFQRRLSVFPPQALSAGDSFFARTPESHPADSTRPGRLYAGVCAPGRGAQTPTVRIWSRLLQHCADRRAAGAVVRDLDPFWTLVGYFNAVRELAAAVALARQDIVQRLSSISPTPRRLDESEPVELSSRADSLQLPGLLDHLAVSVGGTQAAANAVVATSMFGTGVDVDRLGLMVVHGQPKTTSSYIQATGRVGRSKGGLVVTFLRAARPRDLNHYEFFIGFHAAIYRHVEPVTVNPFSPRARDRALGPVATALLRQAAGLAAAPGPAPVHERWRVQQRISGGWYCRAHEMAGHRHDPEVQAIPDIFEARASAQPPGRATAPTVTAAHAASELDRWQQIAARGGGTVLYSEATLAAPPANPVVLGDLAHVVAGLPVAYENAPNSLREVEATTTIHGWRNS